MARKKAINNVMAGGFLVGSVILAVIISFMLSDAEFTRTTPYTFTFTLRQGTPGIEQGSFVSVGGQKVGRVTDVRFMYADETNPTESPAVGVAVTVRIRADVVLYENALVYIERPILGALSSINIADVGTPDVVPFRGGSPRLASDEPIPGRTASALMAQAGLPPEGFAGIFARFDQLTEKTTSIVDEIAPHIAPNVEKITATIDDVKSLTGSTRDRFSEWRAQVDTTIANATAASERFVPLMDKADLFMGDVHASVQTVSEAIELNTPKVSQIVDDVAATTKHVRENTLADLDEAFAKAKSSIDTMSEAIAHLDSLARQETPNIRRMFANGRLASDQFKLLMTELRAQPWRALIRPSTKELEQQLVYDAARAYADSVSNLRAASETLESLSASGKVQSEEERSTFASLVQELRLAFEQYQRAESQFLDRMISER
jgi:ABC-type transporter Mla subunit MlaD